MYRNERRSWVQAIAVAMVLLFSAGSEAQIRPGETGKNHSFLTVLQGGVHVLDGQAQLALSSVLEDGSTVVFAGKPRKLKGLSGGDVIVSGVSAQTPDGLLRRVTAVTETADSLIVETEQATLEDVFRFGRARENIRMYRPDVSRMRAHVDGVRLVEQQLPDQGPQALDTWSPGPIELEFLNTVLYDLDGDTSTTDDQITLAGKLGVEPSFDVDIRMSWGRVTRFSFTNSNQLYTTLDLNGRVTVLSFDKSVRVATLTFAPVVIPVGPIPLVFTPILDIRVGASGNVTAGLESSVTAAVTVGAGVIYENSQWRGYTQLPTGLDDIDVTWENPYLLVLEGKARAYAGPEFSFLLYGIAGPFAKVHGYAELKGVLLPSPTWSLYAGLQGKIGVGTRIPIAGIPAYTLPVFDRKWKLAGGSF